MFEQFIINLIENNAEHMTKYTISHLHPLFWWWKCISGRNKQQN